MTYWQVRADLGEGRQFLFGVSAEDLTAARDKAAEVIGDRTAQVEITETRPACSVPEA
jgi:hypothetical protein